MPKSEWKSEIERLVHTHTHTKRSCPLKKQTKKRPVKNTERNLRCWTLLICSTFTAGARCARSPVRVCADLCELIKMTHANRKRTKLDRLGLVKFQMRGNFGLLFSLPSHSQVNWRYIRFVTSLIRFSLSLPHSIGCESAHSLKCGWKTQTAYLDRFQMIAFALKNSPDFFSLSRPQNQTNAKILRTQNFLTATFTEVEIYRGFLNLTITNFELAFKIQ